jgi:cytochrome P450
MRLWPVAAVGASRSLNEDMNITDDMYLPKGSNIITNFYSMFRSHWIDQPDLFLPDRWSSSNPQLPQLKEMFIPFSIGKRSCLGMNMAMFQLKVVAVYFLYHYDIELVSEPTFELFITFKPDQLMMKLTERKH